MSNTRKPEKSGATITQSLVALNRPRAEREPADNEEKKEPEHAPGDPKPGSASSQPEQAEEPHTADPPEDEDTMDNITVTDRDILFDCPSCQGELIVDRDGEGMETACIHCGALINVPPYQGPPEQVGKTQASLSNRGKMPIARAPGGVIHPPGGEETTAAPPQPGEEQDAPPPVPVNDDEPPPVPKMERTIKPEDLEAIQEFKLGELAKDEVLGKIDVVSRHLKENNSQVTEVTGHVNRTAIQLHRFKIQLERLKKRNLDIKRELRALSARLSQLS